MGLLRWAAFALLLALSYTYIPRLFKQRLAPVVEGYFHPKFRAVAEKLREHVEQGIEEGCAFAVYYKGEPLIDMWGGYADPEAKRPWAADTMANVFSTTKGVAAVTLARMVEKGWLDYDKPVAYYWPEFAQNGKEAVTVEQLISHQAGLIALGEEVKLPEKRDDHEKHQRYNEVLEKAKPFWKPGTKHGYHTITYGFYVDALVQKADPKHRNMSQFFQEEIAEPFGVDFYMGLPKRLYYRMARGQYKSVLEQLFAGLFNEQARHIFSSLLFKPESFFAKSVKVLQLENEMLNDPEILTLGVSSFVGIGTARGIAKLYSYLANGGTLQGKQLVSQQLLKRLSKPVSTRMDEVVNINGSWGLGVVFMENPHEHFQGQARIGHPGYGGQVGLADLTNNLSLGYISNFPSVYGLGDDPRYLALEKVVYDCFYKYINGIK